MGDLKARWSFENINTLVRQAWSQTWDNSDIIKK
jgi:hypothetical protein